MIALAALLLPAFAQNSVPGATKTLDGNASLGSTLKFIEDKVNEQGEIGYTMVSENTIQGGTVEDQYTIETSHAVADPGDCTLEVDARLTMNGKTQSQGHGEIRFRDISTITVTTQSQAITEQTSKAGVIGWRGKVVPENYVVKTFHSGDLSGVLAFRDQGAAVLVAKALNHAVELCGGKAGAFQEQPPASQDSDVQGMPELVPSLPNPMNGQITVKNVGAGSAGPSKLTLDCQRVGVKGHDGGCPVLPPSFADTYFDPAFPMTATIRVPALAVGETFTHTLSFWGALQWPSGKYKFTAVADAAHTVTESDRKNSVAVSILTIP